MGPLLSVPAGIFQKYYPSDRAIIPSGMKSRNYCRLVIVIMIPGGIVASG